MVMFLLFVLAALTAALSGLLAKVALDTARENRPGIWLVAGVLVLNAVVVLSLTFIHWQSLWG